MKGTEEQPQKCEIIYDINNCGISDLLKYCQLARLPHYIRI